MANLRAEVHEFVVANDNNLVTDECEAFDTSVTMSLPHHYPTTSSFEMEQDSNSSFSNLRYSGFLDQDNDMADTEYFLTDVIEEKKVKDKFNVENLSYELQVGYRILSNMMSAGNRCINKLFLYPVDDTFPETADYYEKIKEPMWMFKMKEKFEKLEYNDLTEFMADFRLMIENCYRYNGPDNFVSKKAQKLELMMKQKVALLSRDLREKIASSSSANSEDDLLASAGLRRRIKNPNAASDDPSQQLLSQLRRDRVLQERVDRRQKVEDRKAMEHARIQEMQTWEDSLLGPQVIDQIRTMWELPQIGLFVYLCMESLGLEEEVTQYQIERGLAVPRECSDFRRLMTCLLSTPHQRKSLKSFMPYHVWNSKLAQKLDYFYKVLSDKNGNQTQTCYFLGLDTRAFKVMGKCNPLLKKQFHQLSYLKRVWILKNFCDFCMETQPYLQKTIDEIEAHRPMDVRDVQLGCDARGNRYINFPMFTGKDIRIYKHSKHPEPSLESLFMEDWSVENEKVSVSSSRCSTPVNQRGTRPAETPSTSLRARALLQAAESEEASPLRDTPASRLEVPDVHCSSSDAQTPSSHNIDSASSASKLKQTSSKKRKRGNIFFNKRKRLKSNRKGDVDKFEELGDEAQEDHVVAVNGASYQDGKVGGSGDEMANLGRSSNDGCPDRLSSDFLTNGITSSFGKTDSKTAGVKLKHSISPADSNRRSTSSSMCTAQESVFTQGNHIKQETSSLSAHAKIEGGNDCKITVIKSEENNHRQNVYPSSVDEDRKTERFNADGNTVTNSVIDTKGEIVKTESKSSIFSSSIKQELLKKDETDVMCNHKLKADIQDTNEFASEKDSKCISMQDEKNGIMYPNSVGASDICAGISDSVLDVKLKSCDSKLSLKMEEGQGDSQSKGDNLDQKIPVQEGEHTYIKPETVGEKVEDVPAVEKEEEVEEFSDEEDLPDLGHIELVAESMEEIRELIKKLSNPEPVKRKKKVFPGVMKACEEELVAAMTRFHDELAKYEKSLVNARLGMQAKLRKDVESYVEPKLEEDKGWDSEHSQSSRDASDNEEPSKPDTSSAKQPKRSRQKPSTTTLLSSAASKLSSITGEENGDSNYSFELDISSRGRLRKRRIIPNNTEDTGLKKRKNLPNQDSFFSSSSVVTTTTTTATQVTLPNNAHQQSDTLLTRPLSLVTAHPENSAIKAQLTAQTVRTPGHIVRLLAPGSDGRLKALHVGKPSIILSSKNLSNVRFISGAGTVALPRNKILATSPAHISHPVIQQLLLNQNKPSVATTIAATVFTTTASNVASGLLQRHASAAIEAMQSSSASSSKMPLIITVPSSVNNLSVTKPSLIMASQPATVVVTQVSSSVSQSGKQVLDLGSLSATQLQQLMKNQAIQINTGSGGPTTLLLTTDLQHMTAARIPRAVAQTSTSMEQVILSTNPGTSGASSLLSMIKKPQMVLNNKPGTLVTIPRQVSPQMINAHVLPARPQLPAYVQINNPSLVSAETSSSQGLHNAAIGRAISLVSPSSGTILTTPAQLVSVSNTIGTSSLSNMVSLATTQRPVLAPRIISSMASLGPGRVTFGSNSPAAVQKYTSSGSLTTAATTNPWMMNQDTLKPRIITLPLVHLSPSKKYASNVTVKALIENQNRGTKKSVEEDSSDPVDGDGFSSSDSIAFSGTLMERGSSDSSMSCIQEETSPKNVAAVMETPQSFNSVTSLATLFGYNDTLNDYTKPSQTAVVPATHPLWVDTVAQSSSSICASTSEIILPTMNIKVPSPDTLPSLMHNKNGTTIVQSTKVPIPVTSEAKTGNSLSPSATTASAFIPQVGGFSAAKVTPRAQAAGGNLVFMSPNNITTTSVVSSAPNFNIVTTSVVSAVPNFNVATTSVVNIVPSASGDIFKLPAAMAGLKNVTLKVTPQCGGTGQFVQGFMTSRGLVIPQTVLLQQNQQGNSVILTHAVDPGTVTQLQSNQVKIQPSSVLGTGMQQTVINLGGALTDQLQQNQSNQKVLNAATSSLTSAHFQGGILNQSTNPGVKVMLVNQPASSTSNPTVSNTILNASNQQQVTATTPASELVKQIANSSQVQRHSQYQINPNVLSQGSGQQNAVQLLNSIIQGSVLQHSNSGSGLPVQSNVNAHSAINSKLAAQILALQQNNQLQQQSNIVLAAKPVQNQGAPSSQNKPPVLTFQVQQLGQLISNLGGVAKLPVDGTHQAQLASVQKQVGPRLAQGNQVLQLAIKQPVASQPQSSQVVRVTSQLSPQLQLPNQGMAQIQTTANVIRHQTLIPQHQTLLSQQHTPSFVLQQPSLSQSVLGSSAVSIQASSSQPQISTLQQQMPKVLQQPAAKSQPQAVSKVQFTTNNLVPAQQLISTPQTPGLILPELQAPTVSVLQGTVNQPQVQFLINPSATSLPPLSVVSTPTISPSSCKIQVGSLQGNVSRIIRADSTITPSSLNSHNSSILGFSASLSPQNNSSHAMIVGNSAVNTTTSTTNKLRTHVIIPGSEAGQFLISPVKLAPQNPHTNINPIRFVSAFHGQSPSSVLGLTSSPAVMSNQLSSTALTDAQSQVRPAVIYAGQPSTVLDKKEGKIAQILLTQPVTINSPSASQSQVIVNNHLTTSASAPKLQPCALGTTSKLGTDVNTGLNAQTILYKIGEQYFSSAATLPQVIPQNTLSAGVLSTPGTSSAVSKPDVQLLVPPSFIEASDLLMKQNSQSKASHTSLLQVPALSRTATCSSDHPEGNLMFQGMQKGTRSNPGVRDASNTALTNQTSSSVNGVHHNKAQSSFSLSGPTSVAGKQFMKSDAASGRAGAVSAQTSASSFNGGDVHTQRYEAVPSIQKQLAANGEASSSRSILDKTTARRNTFSGSHDAAVGQKAAVPQRHLSADDSALTLEEQDEKEAALNLLTLANQQI